MGVRALDWGRGADLLGGGGGCPGGHDRQSMRLIKQCAAGLAQECTVVVTMAGGGRLSVGSTGESGAAAAIPSRQGVDLFWMAGFANVKP